MATAGHHLAWVALDQGDTALARSLCGKTLKLYEEIGDERGASDAYEQLGCITLAEADAKNALPHLQRSLAMRRQLGNQHGAASSLRRLAIAYFGSGQVTTAAAYLWQSITLYRCSGMLSRHRFMAICREVFHACINKRLWIG